MRATVQYIRIPAGATVWHKVHVGMENERIEVSYTTKHEQVVRSENRGVGFWHFPSTRWPWTWSKVSESEVEVIDET